MQKFFILGVGIFILSGILMIDLFASRDVYEAYGRYNNGSNRRFSNRIAPFYPGKKTRRPFVRASKTSSFYREGKSITGARVSATKKSQIFKTVKAQNINFNFSVPTIFSKDEDNLLWDSGVLRLNGPNSFIEIEATPFHCKGGKTTQRLCLKENAAKLETIFHSKVSTFEFAQNKTISINLTNPSDPNGLNLAEHLVLRDPRTQLHLLTFVEPINNYIWALKMGANNHPTQFLNNRNTTTKIIHSLFQDITPKRQRPPLSSTKRTSRFSPRKSNLLSFAREKNKTVHAQNIAFKLSVPTDFELVADKLERSGGALQLLGKDVNLHVIATPQICEGDGQDSDKTVRKMIRECLKNKSSFFSDGTSPTHILHDEYIPITLEFEGGKYQEIAHFLMTLDGSQRQVQLTFREPKNNFVWFLGLENYKKESFVDDARKIKRLFSSLKFE